MAIGDLIAAELQIRNLTPCVALTYEGMATGGTLTPGFAAFASPIGITLVTITLDYEGFSDGVVTTHSKTIYPTKAKRVPYNGTGTPEDITVSGSDIIVRFALDNWVYTGCTNGFVTVSSGVYTQGGTPSNASTNFPLTNNATGISYPTPKANFSLPYQGRRMGYNEFEITEVDTGLYEIRAVAYCVEDIDCVKVTATGQTSLATQTVTLTKTIDTDNTYGDRFAVTEYIGNLDYTIYDQDESVDIVPVVYPKIGDTALDFSATGNSHPTWRPTTHTVICDKNHTYGGCVAVVATDGDDATAVVVAESAFNPDSPPLAFATGTAAYNAIRTFNNSNYGRNEAGGGIIYFKAGSYDPWGAYNPSVSNTAYMVIAPFPGVARADVIFTATATANRGPTTYCMMQNVTINMNDGLFGDGDHVILYKLDFVNVTIFYSAGDPAAVSLINNDFAISSQGLGPYSTNPLGLLVRGNYYNNNTARNWIADVSIGNDCYNSGLTITDISAGYGQIHGAIIANNKVVMGRDARAVSFGTTTTNGHAIVNNIFIQPGDPATRSDSVFWVHGDQSGVDPANDWLICNNTVLGERSNVFYNDYNLAAIGPGPRLLVRFQNNIMGDINFVTDDDEHGGGPLDATDGARYGNHALVHGCWVSGNYCAGTGQNSFGPEGGAKNYLLVSDYEAISFVDDQSGRPGFSGSSEGDYHLESGAAPIAWPFEKFLTYDLDGVERTTPDDAGSYLYQSQGPPIPLMMSNYMEG